MLNFRKKFFLIPILFLFMFFSFSQAVFSGDFGYIAFYDELKKIGWKDSSGNIVIPAKFDDVRDFSEGLSSVKIGKKWGFINKSGKLVIPAKFDFADMFRKGLSSVKIGNDWGKINTQGVVVSMDNNNNSNTYTPPQKNTKYISDCKKANFDVYASCMRSCDSSYESYSDQLHSCWSKCKAEQNKADVECEK